MLLIKQQLKNAQKKALFFKEIIRNLAFNGGTRVSEAFDTSCIAG